MILIFHDFKGIISISYQYGLVKTFDLPTVYAEAQSGQNNSEVILKSGLNLSNYLLIPRN